jgi:hypothetical protein
MRIRNTVYKKGYSKATGNFQTKLHKIAFTSSIQKPVSRTTIGFLKLFCDSTADFQ